MCKFLAKLFRKKQQPASSDIKTTPISDHHLSEATQVREIPPNPTIIIGSGQSVGRQRDHNEDSIFIHELTLVGEDHSKIPVGIYIVADGMGGHLHGEVASQIASQVIGQQLIEKLNGGMGNITNTNGASLQEILELVFNTAQEAVQRDAPGGGTTLTTALVVGDQITIAHVGDSRAYFIYPNGSMKAVTQDHSLVRRLVELGQLTEEQAKNFPQKNVLYKAVGQPEPIRPDIFSHPVPRPGYLVLCSDGLWGVVEQEQIVNIIGSSPSPNEACRLLVDAANNAGGPDNISVIIIRFL